MRHVLFILLVVTSVCGGYNGGGQGGAPAQFQQGQGHHHHHQAAAPQRNPLNSNQQGGKLREVFSWQQVDFIYPNAQTKQEAINQGNFDPKSVVPIGVAAAGSRVFLCMPRLKSGVPATIATVQFPSNTSSPVLAPYPSWSWHRPGDCEGITSVFRVKVDECGRLWVLDSGVVNTFVQAQRICPPQVHVFDLSNDRLIFRYRFPNEVLRTDTLLVTLEVEYPTGQCGGAAGAAGAVLYAADTTTFGLIVADLRLKGANSAWRIQDKTMYPSPEAGTYTINGESFEFMDGILGLALSPSNQADRQLYYHAMSSFRERWVRTSLLRNSTAATASPREFQSTAQTRSSQAAGMSIDQNGVIFYGLAVSNTLVCWNTRKPFNQQNLVPLMKDDRSLQFMSTTTVDNDGRLWVVSTRLQKYILETMNPREVNFRVLMSPSTSQLVRGTACERGGQGQGVSQSGGNENQLVFRP